MDQNASLLNGVVLSKLCPRCQRILPASAYYTDPRRSTGLQSWCKECMKNGYKGTQVCTKCGERKPLALFRKDASKPGGYRKYCKDCAAVQEETAKKKREMIMKLVSAQSTNGDGGQLASVPPAGATIPEVFAAVALLAELPASSRHTALAMAEQLAVMTPKQRRMVASILSGYEREEDA